MLAFEVRLRGEPPWSCPVRAGRGALDALVEDLGDRAPGRPLVVITDSTVGPLHARPLADRLVAAGLASHVLTFPAGERNKTRRTKNDLEDGLFRLGVGRDAAVVAVGGGVTGDLAGFVASTWHRGIPVVQVPTTLLAMVDAALGGKTGVDLPGGKNLVGSFHQPWGVYADTTTLDTLPDDIYREGFAEVVKTATIADAAFLRRLEDSAGALLARDAETIEHVVGECLRIKGRVVSRDARERGRRAVLNFGHTVAHALEAASGYAVAHGTAVAVGMVAEARLARERCGFPASHARRLERLLGALGLPLEMPAGVDVDEVVGATARDKKARGGSVRYALPRSLGRMRPGSDVTTEVEPALVREVLEGLGSGRLT